MGGNILLHVATMQPKRIEAMVLVSATMYSPKQARVIMQQVSLDHPETEWEIMRKRHRLGDEQIVALWEWQRGMKDSYDDMNFTPPLLSKITASTLIIYGTETLFIRLRWRLRCTERFPGLSSAWFLVVGTGRSFWMLLRSS